jgi:hypothetical protein
MPCLKVNIGIDSTWVGIGGMQLMGRDSRVPKYYTMPKIWDFKEGTYGTAEYDFCRHK